MNAEQFLNFSAMDAWRRERPTLYLHNKYHSRHMQKLLLDEINEPKEEALKVPYNPALHAMEFGDVLWFTELMAAFNTKNMNYDHVLSSVNGQANVSGAYEILRQKAENLFEGNVDGNLHDFFIYLISMMHHAPVAFDQNVFRIIEEVVRKNSNNRPVEYYQSYDQQGKHLNLSEIFDKYTHVELCLRTIRTFYKVKFPKLYRGSLESWMHQPFSQLILDFRHSEENIKLLVKQLKTRGKIAGEQVVAHVKTVEPAVVFDASKDLKLHIDLLHAGAILLPPRG